MKDFHGKNVASTRTLTKVITYMISIDRVVVKNDIRLGITPIREDILDDALNWLVCNGIILKGHFSRAGEGSRVEYRISDSYKDLEAKRNGRTERS